MKNILKLLCLSLFATSLVAQTPVIGLPVSIPIGTATLAAGTNVTSCLAASGFPAPTNVRGDLTIIGGTATTGTICTVSFSTTLSAAPSCVVTQNGGASAFGIGWGAPSSTAFTITAGITVATSTLTVHYDCKP
jgi:hypothetical protein